MKNVLIYNKQKKFEKHRVESDQFYQKMAFQKLDFIKDQQIPQPKAIIFDFDGSFIEEESLSILARHTKVHEKVKKITDSAMEGKIDYKESLTLRLKLLKDVPLSLIDEVANSLTIRSGLLELLSLFRQRGIPYYIVSSGFVELIQPLVQNLEVSGIYAHSFPAREGVLTGEAPELIIDANVKKDFLKKVSLENSIFEKNVWSFVDGNNDRFLAESSGLSIGCMPKKCLWPIVDGCLFSGSYQSIPGLVELSS